MAVAPRHEVALRVTREARGRVPGDGISLSFGYWPGCGAPVATTGRANASGLKK